MSQTTDSRDLSKRIGRESDCRHLNVLYSPLQLTDLKRLYRPAAHAQVVRIMGRGCLPRPCNGTAGVRTDGASQTQEPRRTQTAHFSLANGPSKFRQSEPTQASSLSLFNVGPYRLRLSLELGSSNPTSCRTLLLIGVSNCSSRYSCNIRLSP